MVGVHEKYVIDVNIKRHRISSIERSLMSKEYQ